VIPAWLLIAFLAFLAVLATFLAATGCLKLSRPTGAQRKAWREGAK
jgi:hypothetical protein